MVSRVHCFELGVRSAWFRGYGVPGFEITEYIVSHYPGLKDEDASQYTNFQTGPTEKLRDSLNKTCGPKDLFKEQDRDFTL